MKKSNFLILLLILIAYSIAIYAVGWGQGRQNARIVEVEKEVVRYVEAEGDETEEETPKMKSLGIFTATAYCPCYECSEGYGTQTATGAKATEGRTIAVDPKVIPYGTEVVINGHTYIAEDCGGAIKGKKIDIYFDTHEETKNFKQQVEVFVVS